MGTQSRGHKMTANTTDNELATVNFAPLVGPRKGSFIGKNGRKISFVIVDNNGPGFEIPPTLDD